MAQSKQAIPRASSADIYDRLTVWIISGTTAFAPSLREKKLWSARDLGGLLQKRHGCSESFAKYAPRRKSRGGKTVRRGAAREARNLESDKAQTRSASLRRSLRLRSMGSSSFLRSRIDFGVTSTSSSSSI